MLYVFIVTFIMFSVIFVEYFFTVCILHYIFITVCILQSQMSLHLSVVRRGLCTKVLPNVPAESLTYETEQRCREVLSRTTLPVKASAGVLVTLCTFRGAPSFLYTLRSPELKGRHKGDIR